MALYLITGGAGFIGSHFVETIINNDKESEIVILDDLSMGLEANVPVDGRVKFVKGDVSDTRKLEEIFSGVDFDYIIHLAAIASVQESINNPVRTHNVNFDAVLNIIQYARKQKNLKRMVFASSAAVYGDEPDLPCSESSAVNPITPYGVDKYAAERYVVNSAELFNVKTTAFRFFNVYGPRQNPSSPYSGVISIFADKFRNNGKEIIVFGDGEQTRDFIFVKDLVSIILKSFETEEAIGKTFNVCTGIESSLNEIIDLLSDISGKKIPVVNKDDRPGDIRRSVGDNQRIKRAGFVDSFTPVRVGLKQLFESI